jgi:hypothetical protein
LWCYRTHKALPNTQAFAAREKNIKNLYFLKIKHFMDKLYLERVRNIQLLANQSRLRFIN